MAVVQKNYVVLGKVNIESVLDNEMYSVGSVVALELFHQQGYFKCG